MTFQVENLEHFLTWIKSCPYKYTISSMSGGFIHVKVLIPYEQSSKLTEENKESLILREIDIE